MDSPIAQQLKNFDDALAGNTVALEQLATQYLPQIIEQSNDVVAQYEEALAPVRAVNRAARLELERRLDAAGATHLKLGEHVARFEKIPAQALVRTDVLREPGLLDELREIIPSDILTKAVRVESVPATTVFKTHLTYLRKFRECGDRAFELYKRLVDEGKPGRRLVVEREQKQVGQAVLQ